MAEKGEDVVIKVQNNVNNITFGRQIFENSMLYSRINRESLDIIKKHFKDEIDSECVKLLVKLKKIFNID